MFYLSRCIGGYKMNENIIYSIGEIAKILDISEHTVRKYENDFYLKIPRNELGHRYYTDKEVGLFQMIISWKQKGLTKTTINELMNHSVDAIDQKEHAMELITLDKLTGKEIAELMAKQMSDMMMEREQKLKEEFNKELKQELKIQLEAQEDRMEEKIKDQVLNQIKLENKNLMNYISATREEDKKKGFWSRLLGK